MNSSDNLLYNLLGICFKSGKLVSGTKTVEEAVRSGKAFLLIITCDIGETTLKTLSDKADYYSVPVIRFGQKEELGHSIGKGQRSAAAITDRGFAKSFTDKYQTQHPGVK